MIISHKFLINKIAREIYPKNNEIPRFKTKKRQRLIGRFQPYRNYNEVGLSSITNLKKDLPINMMDDHRSSDRMSIFYKEKAEELEKRRENPYQRDYFKFQRDHQIPYRLGHEDNEELLYTKFNKNWDQQKKFNLMALELHNFFNDQSLLEIAQPESFIGHFDAIVETQRTLKKRHSKLKHLFIRNRIRYEKWDNVWLNEKFIQPVRSAFTGLTVPHKLQFKATLRTQFEDKKNKSIFDKFLVTKKMSLARGWKSPWNIKFNRKRYKVNTKLKSWKDTNKKNKPYLIIFPNKERSRFHSYFGAVEAKRPATERVDYMNFYNQFGSDAMFSSFYANNFWTHAKMKALIKLEQFFFYTIYPKKYKFPVKRLIPVLIRKNQDIYDCGNSFNWAQTLWMTSFTMLAVSIRVVMATFGLTPIRDIRASFIDQIQTILNLRVVVRNILFKNFLQKGYKYKKSMWESIISLDYLLNEWFNTDLHPFSQFIGVLGLHSIKETILLDPIELKEKDINNKPIMIYPERELGVDAYKMVMDYLFTFYGKKVLPNYGSYIVNNFFCLRNIPFVFSASGCHIASSINQYLKANQKGFRIFFKNYNKLGAAVPMRTMLQKSAIENIGHQFDNIVIDKNKFVRNNKLNIYENNKQFINISNVDYYKEKCIKISKYQKQLFKIKKIIFESKSNKYKNSRRKNINEKKIYFFNNLNKKIKYKKKYR